MSVSADDPERITKWALTHIDVTDVETRECLVADETFRSYAILFRHANTVREDAPPSSDERWHLTNAMFSAQMALRRYVGESTSEEGDG